MRAILGKNSFHFPKKIPEDLKIPKSEFDTLKDTTSIPINFTLEVPPEGGGGQYKNHYEQCIKTLKEKLGIPRDQQIREPLSVIYDDTPTT